MRRVTIKSRALNLHVDLRMEKWELTLLRRADGSRSVREILGRDSRDRATEGESPNRCISGTCCRWRNSCRQRSHVGIAVRLDRAPKRR